MLSGIDYARKDAPGPKTKSAASQCSNDDMRRESAKPAPKANEMNAIPILLEMFHECYPNVKLYISIDGIGVTHEILTLLKQYEYDFVIAYKRSKDAINEFNKLLIESNNETKDLSINSSRIETRVFNLYSPIGIVGIEQWLPYIKTLGK